MSRNLSALVAAVAVAIIVVLGFRLGGEAAVAQSGKATTAQSRCILDNLGKAQTDKAVDLLIAVCKRLN